MPDMGTAQFNETETIMSLGYAIWSFDGSSYQVSDPRNQYLSLAAGEPVAIMVSSQYGGWIKGAAAPHGLWKTGWLPLSHWRGIQFNWLQILTDNIGWKVYHYLGSASHIANGSTTLTKAMKSYRQVLLSGHSRFPHFSTIMEDAIVYGMPTFLRGIPSWRRWKVEIYHWSAGGTHLWPVGSAHIETRWLRSIHQVAGVIDHFKECYACGTYESLSFCVEEWSWDYLDSTWSQVDYR